EFDLTNLAFGTYRFLAVRDRYGNLLYDRQTDDAGTATDDLTLSPARIHTNDLLFRLGKEDTSHPFLSGVRVLDRSRILLRFSEPMDTSVAGLAGVSVTDTLRNRPLNIFDISFNETAPTE